VAALAKRLRSAGVESMADPAGRQALRDWYAAQKDVGYTLADVLVQLEEAFAFDLAKVFLADDGRPLPPQAKDFAGDKVYEAVVKGLRNLARHHEGRMLFLPVRTLAELLGWDPRGRGKDKAALILKAMLAAGVIRMEREHRLVDGKREGRRFTYLPGDWQDALGEVDEGIPF
jgi:hypothetical protein